MDVLPLHAYRYGIAYLVNPLDLLLPNTSDTWRCAPSEDYSLCPWRAACCQEACEWQHTPGRHHKQPLLLPGISAQLPRVLITGAFFLYGPGLSHNIYSQTSSLSHLPDAVSDSGPYPLLGSRQPAAPRQALQPSTDPLPHTWHTHSPGA